VADPISIGLTVAGGLAKGIGQLKAGKAQKRAAYAQALEEERTGAAQVLRIREAARKAIGQQVAGQFANGFEGGTGTALDAVFESQVNMTLDAMTVTREAKVRAEAMRTEGRAAKRQGEWGFASSLIGAASDAYGMVDDWAQAGKGKSGG